MILSLRTYGNISSSIHLAIEIARLEKTGKLIFQGNQPKTGADRAALGEKIVFSPDVPVQGDDRTPNAVRR